MSTADKLRKIVTITAAALLIFGGSVALFVYGVEHLMDSVTCKFTIHQQAPSPDDTLVAVVFDGDRGATTGFNTQVAVVPKKQANSPRDHGFFWAKGPDQFQVRWSDQRSLVVRIPPGSPEIHPGKVVAGVNVTYE